MTEDGTRCVRDIPAQSKAWGLPNEEANKKRKDSFYPCQLEFGLTKMSPQGWQQKVENRSEKNLEGGSHAFTKMRVQTSLSEQNDP